jgi:hypothetical protein
MRSKVSVAESRTDDTPGRVFRPGRYARLAAIAGAYAVQARREAVDDAGDRGRRGAMVVPGSTRDPGIQARHRAVEASSPGSSPERRQGFFIISALVPPSAHAEKPLARSHLFAGLNDPSTSNRYSPVWMFCRLAIIRTTSRTSLLLSPGATRKTQINAKTSAPDFSFFNLSDKGITVFCVLLTKYDAPTWRIAG